MISKWSAARQPVDSIQSFVCVIVFLLFISRRNKDIKTAMMQLVDEGMNVSVYIVLPLIVYVHF